ncbi:hypothetical protein bsdtb5_33770 [Anaeromicropila herbilytica]|uniref:Uncharacterized protein n=1 Tax=Anaeromicropila herbilytica TaxID=2785025 RepID=A0A7R7ENJ2_9FIRM|nr:hypothetical protein bsdtb5_33770 [Anaeromicropila herbilytica]
MPAKKLATANIIPVFLFMRSPPIIGLILLSNLSYSYVITLILSIYYYIFNHISISKYGMYNLKNIIYIKIGN